MDSSHQKIVKQTDSDGEEQPDPKKRLREIINLILPDKLMIVLAVIMAPLVLVPLFVELPESLDSFFVFADYTILGIFIIEYFSKALLARNIVKHVLDPWRLLDLLIVLLPLVSLLPMISGALGVSSPLLRLVRIVRLLAIGGRAIDRKIEMASSFPKAEVKVEMPLEIQVMDGNLQNVYQGVPLEKLPEYLSSPLPAWIDISCVSESNIDQLSRILGVPKILLESELVNESYPRVDYFEHYSMIYARIADVRLLQRGTVRLLIDRTGLLVICKGQNILTLSKTQTGIFNQILEQTRKIYTPGEPVAVSILYTLLKYILEKDKHIINILETELISLENIPPGERPPSFLETTFHLRKEVNQLVPSLVHLKEIISIVSSRRVPLEGFSRHEAIFEMLMDEASYMQETASNARDNLLSLIDLYINTTSYEMNKVMRIIAVITSLSIIPAAMGLLGSNIIGNPWDFHLWQLFAVVAILMLALGWIFYRLGWLKG